MRRWSSVGLSVLRDLGRFHFQFAVMFLWAVGLLLVLVGPVVGLALFIDWLHDGKVG